MSSVRTFVPVRVAQAIPRRRLPRSPSQPSGAREAIRMHRTIPALCPACAISPTAAVTDDLAPHSLSTGASVGVAVGVAIKGFAAGLGTPAAQTKPILRANAAPAGATAVLGWRCP